MLYDGGPWPSHFENIRDEKVLSFLEQHVWMYPTRPRPVGEHFELNPDLLLAKRLSVHSTNIWDAIKATDLTGLMDAVDQAADTIDKISSTYMGNGVREKVQELRSSHVATFPQGAGFGGYIAGVSALPVGSDWKPIKIRR